MPQNSFGELFDLIGSLYEITEHASSEAWSEVYARLAAMVNCGPGSIVVLPKGADAFELLCHNIPPKALKEYNDHYHQVSPFRHLLFAIQPGETFTRRQHMSDVDFEHTEFYHDYLRRYDVYNYRYELLFNNSQGAAGISFVKSKSHPEFTEQELRTIGLATPHIRRAYELHLSIAHAKGRSEMIETAIDRIPRNVVLIDANRRVVFANEGARALLQAGDGISLAADQTLRLNAAKIDRIFHELIRSAVAPITLEKPERGGLLQVSRPSGLRPYSVLVAPFVEDNRTYLDGHDLAIVFLSDPDEKAETVEQVLIEIYDLTPAEAKIASMLTNGQRIEQISDELKITHHTVRSHLKSIFSKTDTSRQSELVKLLLKGPATIRPAKRQD